MRKQIKGNLFHPNRIQKKKKKDRDGKHYSQNLSLLVWFPLPKETDKLNSQVPWKHKSWNNSQNCIHDEKLTSKKRNTRSSSKLPWNQYFEIQFSQKPHQYFDWLWLMKKIISNSRRSWQHFHVILKMYKIKISNIDSQLSFAL